MELTIGNRFELSVTRGYLYLRVGTFETFWARWDFSA